ncbi:OmpA family protein [Methylococcus sp. EFPC2]|uniref:OmpA family protein n=1 Tax=Methylococcus sp. EFPC2 TaxID=2812648 RepID=UPI001967322D|nr:OmpA family protein [Methylococcus sp. EFPC2]QSA96879.1 OmpA family protein [Methylococcus sp. EFPC2]
MDKNLFLKAFALASLATVALAAQADGTYDDRYYIAPFGTFVKPGGDRELKEGWGAGLGVGRAINEYFNVELRGFWQGLDGEHRGGRADLTGGGVDLQYYLQRDTFSPYTVIGLGGLNTSANGKSGASFFGEAGVGASYELLDNLQLRADVRYRYNNEGNSGVLPNGNEFHDLVVNAGFVIPFGDKPAPTRIEPVAAAPAPKPECSTRDSDHDGVSDCEDKCPNTLKGAKVDETGCPIRIELKGVNFHVDSAELTPTAKSILDDVAAQLAAYPIKKDIEVQGHTSSEASAAHNLKLSVRRSQSVADYLKRKGVTNTLHAKGYGEDYPIADNSTEAGREKNRRVELIWIGD